MKRTTVLLALIALGFGTFSISNLQASPISVFTFSHEENKKASYPGGQEALNKFLEENLRYPNNIKRYGKVVIEFTVKKNGKCKDFTVVNSVNEDLDYSAIETLQGMPMWEAAIQDGKKVDSKVKLPIQFSPENNPNR